MEPVEVSMQPALFTSHTGIRYGIAGSVWIEVPEGTTLVPVTVFGASVAILRRKENEVCYTIFIGRLLGKQSENDRYRVE